MASAIRETGIDLRLIEGIIWKTLFFLLLAALNMTPEWRRVRSISMQNKVYGCFFAWYNLKYTGLPYCFLEFSNHLKQMNEKHGL